MDRDTWAQPGLEAVSSHPRDNGQEQRALESDAAFLDDLEPLHLGFISSDQLDLGIAFK